MIPGPASPPGADRVPNCTETYAAIAAFREASLGSAKRSSDSVVAISPVSLPGEREFIAACKTLPEPWRRCLHPERSGRERCFDVFGGADPEHSCLSLGTAVLLRPQGQVAHGVERTDLTFRTRARRLEQYPEEMADRPIRG